MSRGSVTRGSVGWAELARDLEPGEVDESTPLERALVLEETGGPGGAAQPAHSPRAEWSTIPTRSASAEAATEVGVAVSAKDRRTYWEVSDQAKALLSQRGQAHLLGDGWVPDCWRFSGSKLLLQSI